jgi:hypothetical protein
MKPEDMARIIGSIVVERDFEEFRRDPKEYAKKLTSGDLSQEELRFLRNFYIINTIKEYMEKLDIRIRRVTKGQ